MIFSRLLMKRLVVLVFYSGFIINSFCQMTVNDAITAYNKGLEVQKTGNFLEALDHFTECVSIAEEVGETADEVKQNAQNLIPKMHYEIGRGFVSENRFDEAIVKFNKTIEIAKQYNDIETGVICIRVLPQLYVKSGYVKYQANDFDGSIIDFNKAIELDSTYDVAYLRMGQSYAKKDDDKGVEESCTRAIKMAKVMNNTDILKVAVDLGRNYFLKKGNEALKSNYSTAKTYLNTALTFDSTDALIYFLLCVINNALKDYDGAINAGILALKYEQNGVEEKAKIYYELARNYAAKGDIIEACNAYKQAIYGEFKESAENQIKYILKCQ